MHLEIIREELSQDQGQVLKLKGELDAYTAPQLKESLFPLVEKEDRTVQVDLSHVEYMDSTGLGVFIGALKSAQKSNSQLTLLNPKQRIARLFSITGLSEVMDIKHEGEAR